MKRFLVLSGLIFLASFCEAREVMRSSTTATVESTRSLCSGRQRGFLFSVVVSSPGGTDGSLTVYNSSFSTNTNFVGPIDTRSIQNPEYGVAFSSGIMYSKAGSGAVTILYDCY